MQPSSALRRIVLTVFVLSLVLSLSGQSTQAAQPAQYIPAPNLRLYFTGIAGSDGVKFTKTVVTATLEGETLITQADTQLTYFEYSRDPSQRIPVEAPANHLIVWRYDWDENQNLRKVKLTETPRTSEAFLLPASLQKGTRWNTSWGRKREIVDEDATVETPAGRFEHCLVVEYDVQAGGTWLERHYFAPGLGLVKILSYRGPKSTTGVSWLDLNRIEPIPAADAQAIVTQMLER